jgi:hypothetical protein
MQHTVRFHGRTQHTTAAEPPASRARMQLSNTASPPPHTHTYSPVHARTHSWRGVLRFVPSTTGGQSGNMHTGRPTDNRWQRHRRCSVLGQSPLGTNARSRTGTAAVHPHPREQQGWGAGHHRRDICRQCWRQRGHPAEVRHTRRQARQHKPEGCGGCGGRQQHSSQAEPGGQGGSDGAWAVKVQRRGQLQHKPRGGVLRGRPQRHHQGRGRVHVQRGVAYCCAPRPVGDGRGGVGRQRGSVQGRQVSSGQDRHSQGTNLHCVGAAV